MDKKFVSGQPGPDLSRTRTIEQTLLDVRRFNEEKRRKKQRTQTAEALPPTIEEKSEQLPSVEQEEESLFSTEQANAEDWYAQYVEQEKAQAARAVAWARRDHLLPLDDLPF